MKKSYSLHDLPQSERPRERLRKVGVDNLSLQELLALIIEKGKREQNVLTVAQNLLVYFGNLAKVKEASIEELQKVKGVGFATACKLKAAFKLGEKAQAIHKTFGQKIETPQDVYNLLKNDLAYKKKEHFKILSLTSRNRLISIDDISMGTLTTSLAHPREIFLPAIKNSAASIILVHNHPSGDSSPSKNDIEITKKILKASKILGIELLDHLIIGETKFFSFKEKGILNS